MTTNLYQRLAQTLDALPNGFPSTGDGSEIQLLHKLFSPQDAALAVELSPGLETVDRIAARTGRDRSMLRVQLKDMARRGLIATSRIAGGLGFGLMPFVVGIYEMQVSSMDAELAELVEEYFQKSFSAALHILPQFHRVVPVNESIDNTMEILPHESVLGLINTAKSWGVMDCICRKQKALIGQACKHPLDVCMILDEHPGAFDNHPVIRALTQEGALATLKRAADAGLVHCISNNRQGIGYICNCCTCSCGILRGISSLGMANVVARSAFINFVNETLCDGCENCLAWCQFDALKLVDIIQVDQQRCLGCGVCVPFCPSEALSLVRRPTEEILPIPGTMSDWKEQRSRARGL